MFINGKQKIFDVHLIRVIGRVDVWRGPADVTLWGSPHVDFIPILDKPPEKIDQVELQSDFVEVIAENGEKGIFGPLYPTIPIEFIKRLRSILQGRYVFAYESCWEASYQGERHGKSGHYITAVGAVDCALWDLRGRLLDMPVYKLLGGSTRNSVPCYASALGYDTNSDVAIDVASFIKKSNFYGQKWALRKGIEDGEDGFLINKKSIVNLRQAVGEEHKLMFDAFGQWTPEYTKDLFRRVQDYNVTFIEEPIRSEDLGGYRKLSYNIDIPLAVGEHLYTCYEVAEFLEKINVAVLQPDIAWFGGLTEAKKMIALASIKGIPVMPHGGSMIPALHLALSCSSKVLPAVEYHLSIEPKRQYFLKNKFKPNNGKIHLDEEPGLGIILDQTQIDKFIVLS